MMEHETDYEKQRDDRIKRNQEIMKSLGLDQMDFMLHGGTLAKQLREKARRPRRRRTMRRGPKVESA